MDNQTKYQPKTDGLNPKSTFDSKQKGGAAAKANKANSTQNILQLAEIRDGLVIMNDGSFRIVIFCRPINFVLMSEQERSAVEYSYQGFLNSLFFPIQVMIRSRRVDAERYIERLDEARKKQTNMLLELVMEDYINFMADLIAGTDIMDKFFYVVVPYNPVGEVTKDNIMKNTQGFFGKLFKLGQPSQKLVIEESALNDAKRELRRRGQVVVEGLQQCGVMGAPLNTEELIELYYESYNPDTSGGHQLASLRDLSTPLVTRAGEPAAPTMPQLAPAMPAQPVVGLEPPAEAVVPPQQAVVAQPLTPQQPVIPPQQMVAPAALPTPTPQPAPPPPAQPQWPQPPNPQAPAATLATPGQWPQQAPMAEPQFNPYPPV